MGSKEFAQPVRGSGANPVSTSVNGSIETNNYRDGEAFTVGNGTNAYPYTIDPTITIEEINITETGSDIRVDITTTSGDTINGIHLRGTTLSLDTVEVDSITFKDPNASGAATFGFYVGE